MAEQTLKIQTRLGEQEIDADKVLYFPRGIMGFEKHHEFALLRIKEDSPFLMLQSLDSPELGLLVADPYSFTDAYNVHVPDAEQRLLCAKDVHDLTVLVTVSIPHGQPEKTSLNLVGPILLNHEKRLGLQVPQTESDLPPQVYLYEQKESTTDANS